jgi:hypothetical protein
VDSRRFPALPSASGHVARLLEVSVWMLDDEGGCALPEPLHLDEPKWPNVLFCPFLDFF